MNVSKRFQKIASLITLAICLVFAAILVFAFAGCDDTDANGDSISDKEVYDEDEGGSSSGGRRIVLSQVDENIVDTETVFENERTVLTSDFNEYGYATCTYYYPDELCYDENWVRFIGCAECGGPCEGHDCYVTKGGSVHRERIAVDTQVLKADDGSTDINSEIRASLIFDAEYNDAIYEDYYYSEPPLYVEIVSLTGEPLEIESVEAKQYVYYEQTVENWSVSTEGYRSANGLNNDIEVHSWVYGCPDATELYHIKQYGDGINGQIVFSITLLDGNTYSFEYWVLNDPDYLLGIKLIDID